MDIQSARKALWQCMAVGLALQVVAIVLLIAILSVGARLSRTRTFRDAAEAGLAIGGGVCAFMLLVAVCTKPEGRAEQARELVEAGFRQGGGEPVGSISVALLMLIALYGSFAIVEAISRYRAWRRVRGTDLFESARVLAAIADHPTGRSPADLLKWGQRVDSLREPVAMLILLGWVKIDDDGRTLTQRSSAMRAIIRRHPLAEIFESV